MYECPICDIGHVTRLADGTYRCNACGTVMDASELGDDYHEPTESELVCEYCGLPLDECCGVCEEGAYDDPYWEDDYYLDDDDYWGY